MEIGTIIELTDRRGGYIRRKGIKDHLFFHEEALVDVRFHELSKGTKVAFTVTKSLKGPYAVSVTKVSKK